MRQEELIAGPLDSPQEIKRKNLTAILNLRAYLQLAPLDPWQQTLMLLTLKSEISQLAFVTVWDSIRSLQGLLPCLTSKA
jgi:hypothetical protein